MRRERGGKGRQIRLTLGVCFIVAVALIAWVAPAQATNLRLNQSQATDPPSNPPIASLVSQAGVIGYADMVYASLARVGFNVSSFLPISTVTSDTLALFREASSRPAFVGLYDGVGTGGFSIGFGNRMSTGISDVYFVFNSFSGSTTITTTWQGNLTGMNLTGPTTVERPAMSANSVFYSKAWAGSSWWGSGNPTPSIDATSVDEATPAVSTVSTQPQGVPSGVTVDQVASAWDGLTTSNYLLQTGYYTDATAGQKYGQTFYELACNSGYSCPNRAYYYGSGQLQHISFGDDVEEAMGMGGIWTGWGVEDFDFTTGSYAQANFDVSPWLPSGFQPQWVQFIVEAYTVNGVVQQIAKFSQVNFCDATWRSPYQSWTTYGQPNNQYQLEQAGSNYNTNQGYINQNCGHGNTYGAPTVSWVNSNYNYNYAP